MKSKLAKILRKWADLIDPRVKPSDAISIRINVDAEDAIKEIERVGEIAKQIFQPHKPDCCCSMCFARDLKARGVPLEETVVAGVRAVRKPKAK